MKDNTDRGVLRLWVHTAAWVVVGTSVVSAFVLMVSFQWLAAVWVLIATLLFLIVLLSAKREISRRLAILRQAAQEMGKGELERRVFMTTNDDFETLANSLNQMAENLAHSRREIEMQRNKALRSARQARTLYRVSRSLISTLDLESRLTVIAQNLADVAQTTKVAIWLIESSHMVPYASYGLDGPEADVFRNWRVHLQEATGMTREAISEQRPVVVADAMDDERIPKELAEKLNMRSLLAIPFIFEDEPIAYAITFEPARRRRFTQYQKNLALAVAAQAAIAIENARVFERERRIAETLQRALLPTVPPSIEDFEIADKYAPALGESEVGGDFYDLTQLSPRRFGLVIADVSGKGLSAATHTAMSKYMLHAYAAIEDDPAAVMRLLNRALYRSLVGKAFVTMFYGILDVEAKRLAYTNAGHEQPFLYSEGKDGCTRLATTGMALGIVEDYEFGQQVVEFVPGDTLLLYTDGATDVRREGEFLGVEGLEAMFCHLAGLDAHALLDAMDERIRVYASNRLRDDIALMAVKYRHRPSPVEKLTKS